MPDERVPGNGAEASGAGTAKPQDGKGDTVTLSRSEFESMRRDRDEARQSEKFWAEQARRGGGGQQREATEEEPEELVETEDLVPEVTGAAGIDDAIFKDPDKWAEAVSKGPAAIEAFIKKAGYVTAKDAADIAARVAKRTVTVERQKMTSDAVIMRDFPDLGNPQSDLFKETAAQVKALVAMDPRAKNSPATLYAAARAAKAILDAKAGGDRRRGGREQEDDEDRYDRFEDEEDRRHRAASQDARPGRGGAQDEDDDYLGPDAAEVIRQMGVTADDYKAEKKALGTSRPRGGRK